jgi:subtilisin family serine protease
MKKIYLLFLLTLPLFLFSQNGLSYKAKDNVIISFSISNNQVYTRYSKDKKLLIKNHLNANDFTELSATSALMTLNNLPFSVKGKREKTLKDFNNLLNEIEPILIYKDGLKQVCSNEIIIKVDNSNSIKNLLNKYSYSSKENKFIKNQYTVKIEGFNTELLFSLVNELNKSDEVIFAEPNFIRLMKPHTSDPFYNSQWAINNQGYLGGNTDADMDVDLAWSYSTGSGVKVAIIDEGVDLNHPDLTSNILTGYDATGNNSGGAPSNNDAHGTACAGIVSAVANNNKGIAGIAYNSKIIPVRIAYGSSNGNWVTYDSWIANGINWAVQNGADILSNSWGGGSPSNTITNAINNAINNGRNGKGCIVLFATGNHNTSVSYPATLDNTIAVGATNMFDERKSPETSYHDECWYSDCHGGSNYGSEVDVVAPGVFIYSTDISGINGYEFGDYISGFNGTSAACPNVAGIAALILSINPNFSNIEVKNFLEISTDKISNYSFSVQKENGTWNNEVGYGRVNAKNAVDLVISSLEISGNTTICSSNSTYSVEHLPSSISITWSNSSNIQYISGQGTNSYVIKANGSGNGWVEANINGDIMHKDIWVGKPIFTLTPINYVMQTMEPGITIIDYYGTTDYIYQGVNRVDWSYTGPIMMINGDLTKANFTTDRRGGIGYIYADVYNSCGSTENRVFFEVEDGFVMYGPNPADEEIVISLISDTGPLQSDSTSKETEESNEEIATLILYDQNSNMIFNDKLSGKKKEVKWNTSNLKNGTYLLHINKKNETIKKQIIIEHK